MSTAPLSQALHLNPLHFTTLQTIFINTFPAQKSHMDFYMKSVKII